VRVGYARLDGVSVEHLRATVLRGLPNIQLADLGASGRLTSLDVWVDARGVIRRMSITGKQSVYVGMINPKHPPKGVKVAGLGKRLAKMKAVRAWLEKADGKLMLELGRAWSGMKPEIQVTAAVITFLDIGQPQVILVPADAIPAYGLG